MSTSKKAWKKTTKRAAEAKRNVVEVEHPRPGVTLQLEPVWCGKTNCRSCPHGPYWYAYWRQDGRTRSAYVGCIPDNYDRAIARVQAGRKPT